MNYLHAKPTIGKIFLLTHKINIKKRQKKSKKKGKKTIELIPLYYVVPTKMKLNCKEKKALLENLTNRMLKIEHAIGSIKFYEKGNNAKKFPDDEKFANDEKTFENGDSEYLNRSHASSDNGKNDDIEPSREDEKDFNEIKSRLENVSQG